jgi:hypothetical protein
MHDGNEREEPDEEEMCLDIVEVSASRTADRSAFAELEGPWESVRKTGCGGAMIRLRIDRQILK